MAVAGAMLKRDAPLPSRAVSGRACERGRRFRIRRRDCNCSIHREPAAPILITCPERVFDQQPAETRTVDKEFAIDALPVFQDDCGNVSVFGVAVDTGDPSLRPRHSAILGELPQESGVEASVEMIGVSDLVHERFGFR